MNNKQQIITALKEEVNRWEELLNSLSESEVTIPLTPSHWTTKDVVAHLRAWQQVSIANMEAGRENRSPTYPDWFPGKHPAAGKATDDVNAQIYALYRDQPWSTVHHNWRDGFLHFIALGESIADVDLFDKGKHLWLDGYDLAAVLIGSYMHHHQDHFEPLAAWWREHG